MALPLPEPHRHLRNRGGHIDVLMLLYVDTLCAYVSYVVQKIPYGLHENGITLKPVIPIAVHLVFASCQPALKFFCCSVILPPVVSEADQRVHFVFFQCYGFFH